MFSYFLDNENHRKWVRYIWRSLLDWRTTLVYFFSKFFDLQRSSLFRFLKPFRCPTIRARNPLKARARMQSKVEIRNIFFSLLSERKVNSSKCNWSNLAKYKNWDKHPKCMSPWMCRGSCLIFHYYFIKHYAHGGV